ncbi:hypothetical protein FACS1894205_1880 [Alphaproteobacteria bacterium]|nr:hypothetical protein FACS1894205_1880 [Alphaproteobacteria bacterium]
MIPAPPKAKITENIAAMWPYVRPYIVRVMLAMLVTLPIGALDGLIAWSLKPYMDVVLIGKSDVYANYVPAFIIAVSVVQSLLTYASRYLNAWVGNRITADLKFKLYEKLLSCDAPFFDKRTSGEILFRFNSDADVALGGLVSNVRLFVTRIVSSISLIGVLFYTSWQLALIAVALLLVALLPCKPPAKAAFLWDS